ncbi:MAG TPA: (d)CMP kinase [Candidatus Bathyarchaeia archaeon]|nr:(d)CMP kinase [Candidatus Bathyarchaeia archaeon]
MIITLDGPTASGKSTIAQRVAQKKNYFCLCTGFLYRGLAYKARVMGYNERTLDQMLRERYEEFFDLTNMLYHYDRESGVLIFVDGQDVTAAVDVPDIGIIASVLGTYQSVRSVLGMMQHAIAGSWDNVIVDGRDAGSVVFPLADYKFFITAAITVRAERWQKKQAKYGVILSVGESEKLVVARDVRDADRSCDPLLIPDGAYVLDTSAMTIDDAVAWVEEKIDHCVGDNG